MARSAAELLAAFGDPAFASNYAPGMVAEAAGTVRRSAPTMTGVSTFSRACRA